MGSGNPFIYGEVVTATAFADRESERDRLSDRRYRRRLARTLDVISADPGPREWWAPIAANWKGAPCWWW